MLTYLHVSSPYRYGPDKRRGHVRSERSIFDYVLRRRLVVLVESDRAFERVRKEFSPRSMREVETIRRPSLGPFESASAASLRSCCVTSIVTTATVASLEIALSTVIKIRVMSETF